MISLTPKENESNHNQTNCFICQKASEDNNNINHCKVGDYCHYADRSRAPANSSNSLSYKISSDITVFLQTGSSYDNKFFKKIATRLNSKI